MVAKGVKDPDGRLVHIVGERRGVAEAAKDVRAGKPILGSPYRTKGSCGEGRLCVARHHGEETAWLEGDDIHKPGRPWSTLEVA